MKRKLCLLIVAVLLTLMLPVAVLAEFDPDDVSTPHIILMDADTGSVLYEKGAREQAYPASTTKIMTAILAIEHGGLEDIVNVGEDIETRGSTINIVRNEEMSLKDLLYGMMLRSGNDAAQAIAVHVGGSESAFADMMNAKASELGMTGTHFVKPNGLHKDDHYTTAYDMALLARYSMQNDTFREVVSTRTYNAAPTNKDSDGYQWTNTNKLLYTKEDDESFEYKYCTGIKTGDTAQAGRCLVASAEKDGISLILVLFGDIEGTVSGDYRFQNSAKFFDWGFANYSTVTPAELGIEPTLVQAVPNADFEDAENGLLTMNVDFTDISICGTGEYIQELKLNAEQITTDIILDRTLTAPITAGEKLGTVTYKYFDKALFSAEFVASRDVAAIGTTDNADPSPSPLLIEADDENESGGNSWLFWVLLAVVVLIIIFVIRILVVRRNRRHNAKRRRAYRSRR